MSGLAGLALLPVLGARLLPDFRENYLIAHAALRPGISLQETSRVGRAHRHASGGHCGREKRCRADRTGGKRPGPGCAQQERVRDPAGSGAVAHDRAAGAARCARCSTPFPNQLVEIYSVLAERIGETLSGEVAPFFVSVFGPDLDVDDEVAGQIAAVLRRWPQSGTVRLQVPPRQPELQVELRAEQLALYGLQAAEVLQRTQRGLSRYGRRAAQSIRSQCAGRRAHARRRRYPRGCRHAAAARP